MSAVKELRGIIKEKADSGDDLAKGVQDTFGEKPDTVLVRFIRARKYEVNRAYELMKGKLFCQRVFIFTIANTGMMLALNTTIGFIVLKVMCASGGTTPNSLKTWPQRLSAAPLRPVTQGSWRAEINTAVWCYSSTLRTGIMKRSLLMRWFFQ